MPSSTTARIECVSFRRASNAASHPGYRDGLLDGEVAVYDEKLVSRFHLLGDSDIGIVCTPSVFIAFDVLQRGNRDLRRRPLTERRAMPDDQLNDVDMVLPCRRVPDDGVKAWVIVKERGFEGMVAKDPASFYHAGPTRAWVKGDHSMT